MRKQTQITQIRHESSHKTTGGKDEPNIAFMRKSQRTHNTKLKTQRHIIGHHKNNEQHGPQQNIGGELRCSRRLSSFYLLYVMFCDSFYRYLQIYQNHVIIFFIYLSKCSVKLNQVCKYYLYYNILKLQFNKNGSITYYWHSNKNKWCTYCVFIHACRIFFKF